jgi:hypothetical protein
MVLMNGSKNSSQARRDFLKTTGAIGGALITGFPAILSGAPAANALKIGLVGCGGRGTGAASEALKADDYAELTAMADVFPCGWVSGWSALSRRRARRRCINTGTVASRRNKRGSRV